MKKILLFIFTVFTFYLSAQSIVGGSGNCMVNGNPNSVLNLKTINQKFNCAIVIDTTTGDHWIYKVSLAQGSRWENKTQIMKDSLNQKWRLGGNILTTNTVFGTNSDHDLIFVRNGIRAGLINSSLVNTSFGISSLQSNTTGSNNTANGVNALQNNTTGYNNTASGVSTLKSNTTGYNNTASGLNALFYNTTGYNNTASGVNALYFNTTGNNNTASGVNALFFNTTGNNNTASGLSALFFNTTGYNNTASGVSTLKSNTTGYNNTASGLNALFYNTTGYNNTASGLSALFYSTTGNNNTASGVNALFFNTTGNNNTASGLNALLYGKTGSNNTVLLSREDGIVRSIIADSSMNNTLVLGAGGDIRIFSDSTGNTGFGTTTPTNKLHVVGTNPVRLEGLQTGALTDQLVTVDATGVFKQRTVSDVTNYSSYAAISSSTTYTSTSPNITKTDGTITVTLPTASSASNKSFTFVKSDISTVLTIQANGSETINNANFITSNSQWDRITMFSTGTEWLVIGQ